MNFAAETITEIARLREEIKRGTRVVSLSGLTSIAAKAFVFSELKQSAAQTFVIVTDSNKDSDTWECDLEFFSSRFQTSDSKFKIQNSKLIESGVRNLESEIWNLKSGILTLPSFESDIYANVSPHAETLEKRALALWNLTQTKPDFLILSAKSLITKTLAPNAVKSLGAHLKRDADFAPELLIEKLVASGYVREEPLKSVGELSVRGGILDVWSPDAISSFMKRQA